MSDDLVFYTSPMSRGRIVRWMLEEAGVPYRTELVAFGAAMRGDAFRAVNPMMKVPAIVHGGVVVTEVAAICAWLADTFPAAGLAPPGAGRAAYYRWLFFAAGPLEAAVTDMSLGVVPPVEREPMVGYGNFARMLDTIETAVTGREYVAGDRFSAADVYVGSQLGWGMRFGSIETRPAFTAYVEPLMARPAAVRARAIDDALLPPEQRGKM